MTKEKSYMELCLHIDGKENVYLRVPTVWDPIKKQWIGFIKTPITNRLIHGEGSTNFELENSFNVCMSKLMQESDELHREIFEMFMPTFYWEN
jgi:hypothetical protein